MDEIGFRIRKLTEDDFDQMILASGGKRLEESDVKTADYLLGDSVIELKLIDEEGLEKTSRQKKLAKLFMESRPNRPVIPLTPHILSETDKRSYYNILRGPIQTQVKKAAKQLEATRAREAVTSRILIIINNGYAALHHDEFTKVVLQCVQHDTSKIDTVLCGGIYFYSAWPDGYVFPHLDIHPISLQKPHLSLEPFMKAWNKFEGNLMKDMMVNQIKNHSDGRPPVLDIPFKVDGVTFVKPARKMGKPSPLWPNGIRPRNNTSSVQGPQPVALTFPSLSKEEWLNVKAVIPEATILMDTFEEWQSFERDEEADVTDPLKLFVTQKVTCEDWRIWCRETGEIESYKSLHMYSEHIFNNACGTLMRNAISIENHRLFIPEYVRVETEEIGLDMANDVSSAHLVCEREGLKSKTPLFENLQIFHEHAVCLGAAYAVKHNIPAVRYHVDKTYGAE